ncbi:MAG TPA: prolyl oligopeptidase family serine peptidase [Thermoanaerobaculia bacterium]|nr:prolyl oligopeptidase family serine peptidase [Thermoanaerobaculia bacterium]
MRKTIVAFLTALSLALSLPLSAATKPAGPAIPPPPATEVHAVTETLHGVEITDPYRWLEDQKSPETRAWIDRENAYTDKVIGNLPRREAIAKRVEALLNTDQIGLPTVQNGRYFFTRRRKGEDLFSIYMREGAKGADVLLIDPAPMNPKHTTNVGIEAVSRDGKLVAYYVREGGADEVEVRFFDVDARHDTGTPLIRARYEGVSVSANRTTAYYTRVLEAGPRVFRRSVSGSDEEKLFGDAYTPDKIIYSNLSDDGKYLLIQVLYGSAARKTDLFLMDVLADGPVRTVVNDLEARSVAEVAGDQLVIQTNWNAPNNRVMVVGVADPARSNWKELIPENKNAAIQSVSAAGGSVFVNYLENVKPRIVSFGLDGKQRGEIAFDTIGRLEDVSGTWSSPVAFFRFSSFATPPTIYSYDVAGGKRDVFAQAEAPVQPSDFTVEQVWYQSTGGTRVPMFLFYKKGLKRDRSNPTYLTGYGGFNLSQLPTFSARAVAWAEQGGVYALANLRGGGEFGEAWHHAGMLEKKQNVFDDFYAAAEYLIAKDYTSAEHLGISGNSNGGLLVTAALTQRPSLFKAVICGYPLVDMLRYHKFLVGSFWVPEYGSADDAEAFKWIYAYSPYQHVKKGTRYPAVLFITGDADTRVAPLHARKMAALMQASGSGNPVLIRYHVSGGHSGGEPVAVQVKNEAESLSFLLWQLK